MAAHRLCVLSRQLSPAPASAVDDDDDAAITMQLGADGKFKPGVGARYVHVKGAEAVRFVLSQGRTFSSVPPAETSTPPLENICTASTWLP